MREVKREIEGERWGGKKEREREHPLSWNPVNNTASSYYNKIHFNTTTTFSGGHGHSQKVFSSQTYITQPTVLSVPIHASVTLQTNACASKEAQLHTRTHARARTHTHKHTHTHTIARYVHIQYQSKVGHIDSFQGFSLFLLLYTLKNNSEDIKTMK